MKLLICTLFSLAAFAQPAPVAAKPDGSAKAPSITAPALPSTAKLWRLVSETQQAQTALETAQKSAKDSMEALQVEQKRLADVCGVEFMLSIDQDPKSQSFKDLVCISKPKEQPTAEKK